MMKKTIAMLLAATMLTTGWAGTTFAAEITDGAKQEAPNNTQNIRKILNGQKPGDENGQNANNAQKIPNMPQMPDNQDTDDRRDIQPAPPEWMQNENDWRNNEQNGHKKFKGRHGDSYKTLESKIDALEDEDVKTDLKEKMQAMENAKKEFMDAAKAAGIMERPDRNHSQQDTEYTEE